MLSFAGVIKTLLWWSTGHEKCAAVHKDVGLIPVEPLLMKCGCVLPFRRLCFLNILVVALFLDVTLKSFSAPVSQKIH